MRRGWTWTITGLTALAVVSCTPGAGDERGSETMEPTPVRMADALRVTADNLAFVTAEKVEPNNNDTQRMGCKSSYNSALPEGPPWRLRLQREFASPTAQLVNEVLSRLDSLPGKGFHRQGNVGPDPEPPNSRTYRDAAGYVVGAYEDVRGNGITVYVVTSSSPCAE